MSNQNNSTSKQSSYRGGGEPISFHKCRICALLQIVERHLHSTEYTQRIDSLFQGQFGGNFTAPAQLSRITAHGNKIYLISLLDFLTSIDNHFQHAILLPKSIRTCWLD